MTTPCLTRQNAFLLEDYELYSPLDWVYNLVASGSNDPLVILLSLTNLVLQHLLSSKWDSTGAALSLYCKEQALVSFLIFLTAK